MEPSHELRRLLEALAGIALGLYFYGTSIISSLNNDIQ